MIRRRSECLLPDQGHVLDEPARQRPDAYPHEKAADGRDMSAFRGVGSYCSSDSLV